jgi:hypothetical protein
MKRIKSKVVEKPSDRYAIELVISGLLGALVRSKAVKVNILEDHVLVPLLHHMQVHESYKNKAASEQERARHNEISFECMTWHAHLENVFNGLK